MPGGSVCWMHDEGQEHVAVHPVGVVRTRGDVIPADYACAQWQVDQDQIVDATEVTVGWVRS